MRMLPPFRESRRLRRAITVPNVLATVALLVSLTGTSYAAMVVTGKNIKDSSITGVDVKNRSITSMDFTSGARTALAVRGPDGPRGPQGDTGVAGSSGPKGNPGARASRAFSFVNVEDTQVLATLGTLNVAAGSDPCFKARIDDTFSPFKPTCLADNTGVQYDRWNNDCDSISHYCNFRRRAPSLAGRLSTDYTVLMKVGMGSGSNDGGFLSLDRPGNIIVTGSAVFFHSEGDSHSRIQCQPQVRLTGSSSEAIPMDTPTILSSALDDQLVTMSFTGGANIASVAPPLANYDFQLQCKELDDDGTDDFTDWWFVKGNLNATSTEA